MALKTKNVDIKENFQWETYTFCKVTIVVVVFVLQSSIKFNSIKRFFCTPVKVMHKAMITSSNSAYTNTNMSRKMVNNGFKRKNIMFLQGGIF